MTNEIAENWRGALVGINRVGFIDTTVLHKLEQRDADPCRTNNYF